MGEDVADGDDSGSVPVRVHRFVDGSQTVATISRISSVFANASERVAAATRNSFIYRWLTKEPEPEVIVIDLRETRTVGPFINVFEAVSDCLEPYWHESRLRQALIAVDRGIERAADTRIGGIVTSA